MDEKLIEVRVVYHDNSTESYQVPTESYQKFLEEAQDESRLDFYIDDKKFIKKEVEIVGTDNYTVQFLS